MACKEKPKKTSSSSGGDSESGDSSCTVSDPGRGGADPTNPVPWFAAAFGLGGLATARRLRARKASKQGNRR
jgi:hypothetical protein